MSNVTQTVKKPVGRPPSVLGGRVQVYLDAKSLEMASKLGAGNVSQGIRKALMNACAK